MPSIRKIKKTFYARLNKSFREWEFDMAKYFSVNRYPLPNIDVFKKTLDELRANGSLAHYRTVWTTELPKTIILRVGLRTRKQMAVDEMTAICTAGIFMRNNVISALMKTPFVTKETDCALFPPGHPIDQEDRDRHNKTVVDIRIPKEGLFYNGIDVTVDNGKVHFCVY